MIKVNDIVELNSIEYRVIQLFGCLALILPMKGQSVDLISMDADDLNDGLLKGTVLLKKDPWIDIQYRKLTDVMLKTAKENYELIKSIISTPDLYKLNGRPSILAEEAFRCILTGQNTVLKNWRKKNEYSDWKLLAQRTKHIFTRS